MAKAETPLVGITMGDAAGIGPEIVLKALADPLLRSSANCVVIGDLRHLKKVAAELTIDIELAEYRSGTDAIEVFDLGNVPSNFNIGTDAAGTGRASVENIEASVDLWRQGKIQAVATAPISKKAIGLAGYDYPGHTEFFASLTDTREFRMSFFGGRLRVILLSTHLSLLDAISRVKKANLIELITFCNKHLGQLLRKRVKIAVAGLNPHASEGGMFGSEEADEILPAIAHCRNELGIDVIGPYSPDTIFLRAHRGEFDVVVALYHDQATIPVKSLSFGSAVNVTLGLPLIRTSVDHGTAYDIAGKGMADPSSMAAAIKLAAELATS